MYDLPSEDQQSDEGQARPAGHIQELQADVLDLLRINGIALGKVLSGLGHAGWSSGICDSFLALGTSSIMPGASCYPDAVALPRCS